MIATVKLLSTLETHGSVASLLGATEEIMIGTTISGISYQLRDVVPYADVAGMLLNINGKFTLGKLKSSLLT